MNRDKKGRFIIKHDMSSTRFYKIWSGIKFRCSNPTTTNFQIYGGRGIKCLWNNFDEFKKDMFESYQEHCKKFRERDTTIDRIDSDGHYCKENCRWATQKFQQRNRRNNHLFEFNGVKMTIPEWSEYIGMNAKTLTSRIYLYKWPIEKALTKAVI